MTTAREIDISNNDDLIDVRNLIERVEELEADCADEGDTIDPATEWERAELATLKGLLADLKGNGGDHEYQGDWYPVTLIRDSYFEDYAREFAEDIGAINRDIAWPATCINWEKAAEQLQSDYQTVEFDGATYWYR